MQQSHNKKLAKVEFAVDNFKTSARTKPCFQNYPLSSIDVSMDFPPNSIIVIRIENCMNKLAFKLCLFAFCVKMW